MTRVLVTGAGGFVGRPVVAALRAAGAEVQVPGRDELDVLDPGSVRRAFAGGSPGHLVHLAWSVPPGAFWTAEENLDWIGGSLGLLRAFAAAGGRRALLVGSCAEYAWDRGSTLAEDGTPLRPATLYGAAKHALHTAAAAFARQAGIELAWGRLFWLYGPGEPAGRLVSEVARALVEGREARTSDGAQRRDYLHVEDAGRGLAALALSDVTGAVNVASGRAVAVRDVVGELARAAGRPDLLRPGALPTRPGDPPELVADVARLRDEVGFAPSIGLAEGCAGVVRALSARGS